MENKNWITITAETHQMLAAAAVLPFHSDGHQMPDGKWSVPVGEDVYERLLSLKMEGETFDDVIQRALQTQKGLN